MTTFIKGLKLTYSQPYLTIEWSYDILVDRQVYDSLLCWGFLTLSILCYSVQIARFRADFS
jgi:hypothetical protein